MNLFANIKESPGKVLAALSFGTNVKLSDKQYQAAKLVIDEHPAPRPTLKELVELWQEDVDLQEFSAAVARSFLADSARK